MLAQQPSCKPAAGERLWGLLVQGYTLHPAGDTACSQLRDGRQVLGERLTLEINQIMLSGACPSRPQVMPSQYSGGSTSQCPPTVRVSQWQTCWWAIEQEFSATGRKSPFHHSRAGHIRCNFLGSKEHWKAQRGRPQEKSTPGQISQGELHRTLIPPFFQICGLGGRRPLFPNKSWGFWGRKTPGTATTSDLSL